MFSTNLFLYRVELFSLSIHNNVDIRQRMVERREERGEGKTKMRESVVVEQLRAGSGTRFRGTGFKRL